MIGFAKKTGKLLITGGRRYYLWVGVLTALILIGLVTYVQQLNDGLILTAMRDQVSWGLYISNFTFLVGVAAAAVLLIIPAYVYDFKPIREIALFGEMIAVTALLMCLLFIGVDLGNPINARHMIPFLGTLNFPSSLLAWDMLSLNAYLGLNLIIVLYVLITAYRGRTYDIKVMWPLIVISIPMAISIHTVTAFLYNGLSARPFWNASILAPRFIASALCSGPALMLVIFQIARRVSDIDVTDAAIHKIAELIPYAIGFNLFLFAAEFYKEFYSGSIHMAPMQYLYFGLHGHHELVPWMWMALAFNITAFFLFLLPRFRENHVTLNIACVLIFTGVFIEKGMGLVIPGFIPGTLGEIYDYSPTFVEYRITLGIWAFGALSYTLLIKVAIPIYKGEMTVKSA